MKRSLVSKPDPSEPVRKGKLYCAPCCGAGCTWTAYQAAVKAAAALAEAAGPGWKPMVWENLGWHSRADKGCAQLHINKIWKRSKPTYSLYFDSGSGQIVANGSSVKAVLANAKAIASDNARQLVHDIQKVFES